MQASGHPDKSSKEIINHLIETWTALSGGIGEVEPHHCHPIPPPPPPPRSPDVLPPVRPAVHPVDSGATPCGNPHGVADVSHSVRLCFVVMRDLRSRRCDAWHIAQRVVNVASRFTRAGTSAWPQVRFDSETKEAEASTASNNYALAWFIKARRGLPPGVELEKAAEFYFSCCSISVSPFLTLSLPLQYVVLPKCSRLAFSFATYNSQQPDSLFCICC